MAAGGVGKSRVTRPALDHPKNINPGHGPIGKPAVLVHASEKWTLFLIHNASSLDVGIHVSDGIVMCWDLVALRSFSDLLPSPVVGRVQAIFRNNPSALYLPQRKAIACELIPKSNLPGDRQIMNARGMERAGGSEILYEEIAVVNGQFVGWVNGKIVAEKLVSLLRDNWRLNDLCCRSPSFFAWTPLQKSSAGSIGWNQQRISVPAQRLKFLMRRQIDNSGVR
jgi:hypothetical protein